MKAAKEFASLSEAQLQERLKEFKKELLKLHAQVASGAQAANPGKIRQTKKNIARMKTFLKIKEANQA